MGSDQPQRRRRNERDERADRQKQAIEDRTKLYAWFTRASGKFTKFAVEEIDETIDEVAEIVNGDEHKAKIAGRLLSNFIQDVEGYQRDLSDDLRGR